MAEFLPDEEELDEEEEEVEPYPIPRRVRTKRPWRAIICTLLIVASVGVLFYGIATPIFDANEGARLSRIESLETQVEDEKLKATQANDSEGDLSHNPKAVCDTIAKAQSDMVVISREATIGADTEKAVANLAKDEFSYMKNQPEDAAPWVWISVPTQATTSYSWKCLTPLTFEGDETTVAWALMGSSDPYAIATATYDASGETPQISDVDVTLTLAGQKVFSEPPTEISALFSDPAWVKENSPKTSVIQSIQSSYKEEVNQ